MAPLGLLFSVAGCAARADAAEQAAAEPQPLRVYYIGNSVTDTVRYASLEKMAAEAGKPADWGGGATF